MEPDFPRCALCNNPVDRDDYCYGCKAHVCKGCEGDDPPLGPHDVNDHDGPAGGGETEGALTFTSSMQFAALANSAAKTSR